MTWLLLAMLEAVGVQSAGVNITLGGEVISSVTSDGRGACVTVQRAWVEGREYEDVTAC